MIDQVYVEKDCSIELNGRKYEYSGAMISPDYAIGYLHFEDELINPRGVITDWHGNELGTAKITSKWRAYSWRGTYMYQVECTINNMRYTGRSFGSGMIWKGKRIKNQ